MYLNDRYTALENTAKSQAPPVSPVEIPEILGISQRHMIVLKIAQYLQYHQFKLPQYIFFNCTIYQHTSLWTVPTERC